MSLSFFHRRWGAAALQAALHETPGGFGPEAVEGLFTGPLAGGVH